MIVGDRTAFAIESEITKAFPSISQRALGSFVLHIRGRTFGVQEPDASMLGHSFHEVNDRLRRRGTHCIPVLADIDAAQIADAYIDAIFRETTRTDYFGLSREEFTEAIHTSAVTWAPDGDEAFDDGSYVLQLDVGNKVRLIAFINTDSPEDVGATLSEEWLDAGLFYGVLSRWSELFAAEWAEKSS
ncbi:hypothetical protein HFO88_07555 [Rhizobium leguminosarum]|uniref:Imm42 family immunity protein n=1 Tax=Rhizobium leguminosarum TaxID=384 RepID=UPI001C9429BF|nr:Imm42 family immunity protein [Rhizobium leguminosarum]MBY5900189.1 hypothetical protein [Rhizobium leguminosarum]MBY5906391.1 hypothetical protein [Rhizobium leguminosarum]